MKKEFFQWLSDTDRLRIRFKMTRGKVTTLVVQYEALIDSKWEQIVRYDTAHGYLHKDLYVAGQKEKIKKERVAIVDFNKGLTEAVEDLKRHWQKYRRRFTGDLDEKISDGRQES